MSFSPLCRRLCKYRARISDHHQQDATSPESKASPPTPTATIQQPASTEAELSAMALRTLVQAKVIAGNAIHELETIDCFTDDWDLNNPSPNPLATSALDIHLHCQYAAEEAKSILEIMDGFLANPSSGQQVGIFAELDVRRNNAVDEVKKLQKLIGDLGESNTDPALSLREMGKRAERLVGKIEGLKAQVDELEKLVYTPLLQQQGQATTPAQQQQGQ